MYNTVRHRGGQVLTDQLVQLAKIHLRGLAVELASPIDYSEVLKPASWNLSYFFPDRHARQKVADTLLNWK